MFRYGGDFNVLNVERTEGAVLMSIIKVLATLFSFLTFRGNIILSCNNLTFFHLEGINYICVLWLFLRYFILIGLEYIIFFMFCFAKKLGVMLDWILRTECTWRMSRKRHSVATQVLTFPIQNIYYVFQLGLIISDWTLVNVFQL